MSYIKGSSAALDAGGRLSREEYCEKVSTIVRTYSNGEHNGEYNSEQHGEYKSEHTSATSYLPS